MIILACDGCLKQSPDSKGRRVADDWTTITFQSQRQRNRENQGTRIVLCEDCLPRLGNDLTLDDLGVETPMNTNYRG